MRQTLSPAAREVLATLPSEIQSAVLDGRAKISRSGRVTPCAPEATARNAYSPKLRISLDANPNRGKRHAARQSNEPRLSPERAEPVTLSFPGRDSIGRPNPRMERPTYTVRRIPSLKA